MLLRKLPDAKLAARIERLNATQANSPERSPSRPKTERANTPKTERTKKRKQAYVFAKLFSTVTNIELDNCIVKDISVDGAKITLNSANALPEELLLILDNSGCGQAATVIWRDGNEAGLKFS